MSRLIVFLLIVGLLAACGQPGSTALPTATSSVPTQPIPTVLAPTQPAPTGTPIGQLTKAPFVRIAVRAPDDSIQIVNTQVPADPRPVQITTGFWPQAGVVSGTVYALDHTQPRVVAMDKDGTRPLDFIQQPRRFSRVIWRSAAAGLGSLVQRPKRAIQIARECNRRFAVDHFIDRHNAYHCASYMDGTALVA